MTETSFPFAAAPSAAAPRPASRRAPAGGNRSSCWPLGGVGRRRAAGRRWRTSCSSPAAATAPARGHRRRRRVAAARRRPRPTPPGGRRRSRTRTPGFGQDPFKALIVLPWPRSAAGAGTTAPGRRPVTPDDAPATTSTTRHARAPARRPTPVSTSRPRRRRTASASSPSRRTNSTIDVKVDGKLLQQPARRRGLRRRTSRWC